jgi:hypothetical protein
VNIPATPLGLEYPSPISGQNGSLSEDGSYEDDAGGWNLLGAEAAKRNDDPLVASLVRLTERGTLSRLI